jgi:hypothetical protein
MASEPVDEYELKSNRGVFPIEQDLDNNVSNLLDN